MIEALEPMLLQALEQLQIGVAPATDAGADLVLDVDGTLLPLELKRLALIDIPRATHEVRQFSGRPSGSNLLIVADRIVESARQELNAAGISWLDLRGHLHLHGPSLRVDVPVGAQELDPAPPRPLTGRIALAVAVDLLLFARDVAPPGRDIARRLEVAPSSVSRAMAGLREAHLVDGVGNVDLKALFWEVAQKWQPRWRPVALPPSPGGLMNNPALSLGFDNPSKAGWALTGDAAARYLGAPIVTGEHPTLDFYLPTAASLRLAQSALGTPSPGTTPAARLAHPIVPAAYLDRIDVSASHPEHWMLTRPLFVALELARDPGRGTTILNEWHPTDARRVW